MLILLLGQEELERTYSMADAELPADCDPRFTGDFLRRLSGPQGSITLVGVAHDHPSSVYRVRTAIEAFDPDTLALELPPMAIPLFEQYANDARTPPALGGEMSAAIQAADAATVTGIDRPTAGYYRRLLATIARERSSLDTLRNVLEESASTLSHAVACRLAALLGKVTPHDLAVDTPTEHEVDHSDEPSAQAADERSQIRRSRAVLDSLGSQSYVQASRIERDSRDIEMANRLADFDGDTLAVVGISHLDALVEQLQEADWSHR